MNGKELLPARKIPKLRIEGFDGKIFHPNEPLK